MCVLTAGRLDRIPPDGGLTFVDFIVYQGNPMGSITGHELIPTWWDGTSCKEVILPEVCIVPKEFLKYEALTNHRELSY